MRVGVIDYGMGNLHSVAKAISLQGGEVTVTDSRSRLRACDLLVLPGVGAFGAAMVTLAKKRLDDFLRQWLESRKPYVGICLGFQMLFERSQENPSVPGLGALKGSVVKFRMPMKKKARWPIPHMGWNTAQPNPRNKSPYLNELSKGSYYYFVHSYYPVPADPSVVGTITQYGVSFCSSVATSTLFASQFHPEKSGVAGLQLLGGILKEARV